MGAPRVKRKLLVAIFALGVLAIGSALVFKVFNKQILSPDKPAPSKTSTFFVSIPINQFSAGNIPCLEVEIEEEKFTLAFDIGFQGNVSLLSELLPKIKEKQFDSTAIVGGMQGVPYEVSKYRVPKMYIGPLTFSNLLINEQSQAEFQEFTLFHDESAPPSPRQGDLGWTLFSKTVLFLDLDNDTIAVADSIETFRKSGPSLEAFTKVPLLTDNKLLEIEVNTSQGPLRCILDTGCTYNMMPRDNPEGKSAKELMQKEKIEFTTFQIGGKEFGTINFHPFPIKLPITIGGILGMEFLFDHQVVIDFKNGEVYIRKQDLVISQQLVDSNPP